MKTERHEKLILVDADVIIHLSKADRLTILKELFEGRIYVLDYVLEELKLMAPFQLAIILGLKILQEMKFPTNRAEVLLEYNKLKKTMGKGESACMAVCRYQKDILASSNLKDIKPYCEEHQIEYLTTLDILAIAYLKKKMTAAEVDHSIYQIKSKQSRLPKYDKIEDFIRAEFDKKKITY
jgi:predicted nucleic acid-binding protein